MRDGPLSRTVAALAALALGAAALASGTAQAQALGRLFSTVEERLRLDEARDAYEPGKPPPAAEPEATARAAAPEPPPLPQVTVNGVVLRSSGNDSSWLNGRQIPAGQATVDGIRVEPRSGAGASVRLVLPSGADTAPIKPGQRIDVATGSVIESYQRDERGAGKRLFRGPAGPEAPPGAGAPAARPPGPGSR